MYMIVGIWLWVHLSEVAYGEKFALSQVHLAYSYTNLQDSSMYIMWNMHIPANYCMISYAAEGKAAYVLVHNYTHDLSEENYFNYVYKARLRNLAFDRDYYYSVMCKSGLKEDYRKGQFHSHPGYSDNTTLLVMGDWATAAVGKKGHAQHTQVPKPNVLSALQREEGYSSVWHLGDLAYNLHSANGKRGDEFFEAIEPVIAGKPFMAVPGNHEVSNRFLHYDSRLEFPSLTNNNLYYSVDIGKAHVIMLCTDFEATVPGRPLSDPDFQTTQYQKQRHWLISDLNTANNNRANIPWIVVLGHKPLYCSSNEKSDMMMRVCIHETRKMRESFEELFVTYGVNVYLSGHLHLYERLDPVLDGLRRAEQVVDAHTYRVGAAPIYLVNGVAGNLEKEAIIMKPPKHPLPYSAFISEALGYGFLHVCNSSHLLYEQIAFGRTQFDEAGRDLWPTRRVEDYVWIVNQHRD